MRLLSATQATVSSRSKVHPGLIGPQRFVGLRVPAAGGVSFRRARSRRSPADLGGGRDFFASIHRQTSGRCG